MAPQIMSQNSERWLERLSDRKGTIVHETPSIHGPTLQLADSRATKKIIGRCLLPIVHFYYLVGLTENKYARKNTMSHYVGR